MNPGVVRPGLWECCVLGRRVPVDSVHRFRFVALMANHIGDVGVAGLLLGHWWPGVTVRVQEDGTVIPASPGLSALMRDVPIGSMDVARTIRRLEVLVQHRGPIPPDG